MRSLRVFAVGAVVAGLTIATPSVASAWSPPEPDPEVVSQALATPFDISLARGDVYVADGVLGLLEVEKDGSTATVVAGEGIEGVAHSLLGRSYAYTTTVPGPEPFTIVESGLTIVGTGGDPVYADTLAYERANNPDQAITYGVANASPCVADALTAAGLPVQYTGIVDSHAYGVVSFGTTWVVADAAANALLSIDRRGNIRTLAVLPPQPVVITAEIAAAFGLPDCVVGITYTFESVPTDVEVGLDGQLYVSLLPGGPESPVLGARGSVYRVSPWSGKAQLVASGFLGATDLAIGLRREIYVAELFGGRISVVRNGQISELVSMPGVTAVEFGVDGSLWAATLGNEDPPAPGALHKVWEPRDYWLGGWF